MTQTLVSGRATEFDVRVLADDELRGASTVFREALHEKPHTDEEWATAARGYESGRNLGAFAGSALVGTAGSLRSGLTVPGGATVPLCAVTFVGVRADHRRRGVLTGMMRRLLADAAAAGEVVAALHASEPTIYGRFGYGVADLERITRVRSRRAAFRPTVPVAGTVRLLDLDEALAVLPGAYRRLLPGRPGMVERPPAWWVHNYEERARHEYHRIAAHVDATGAVDGFLGYRPGPYPAGDPRADASLQVLDFQAANQGVANDLWRYLLGVDLIDEVTVYGRPQDDPLDAMLVDSYAVRGEWDGELWLRVVDVPAALAAREYGGAEPVVLEVVDPLLPANSGRYLISPQGTERTEAPAALTLDAEVLAMIYLGAWRPSALAAIGRLTATDAGALAAADRLFATDRPAWCGTLF